MTEPVVIALLASGPLFWMWGGYRWKPARRWVWPILAGILLRIGGIVWWKAMLVTLTMIGVNLQGYGDASSWWKRTFVFTTITVPSAIVSWKLWPVVLIGGAMLTLLFWLTRKSNWVTWKIFESFCGLFQASALVMAVLR